MIYILAAILIFGVLIAVHELGHFLAAKACGVRVNEFAIGMGPALFKKTRGDTTYALRLLPIGGFCAPLAAAPAPLGRLRRLGGGGAAPRPPRCPE